MRQLALVGFGLLLLVFSGAMCRGFHLEWFHIDSVLVLTVFIAMYCSSLSGVFMVFGLGIMADAFASTPPGMLANCYLSVWLVVRWSRQVFFFKHRPAQLALVLCMSLMSSMLVMVHLAMMDITSGPMWVCLKAMLPVAMMNTLLAVPIWALAEKIHPPEAADRASMLLSK